MSDNNIPPPREEKCTVFGVCLEPKDIAWVEKQGGMDWFACEMEQNLASLPDQGTVGEWKKLVRQKQEIETQARLAAYTALKQVLPPDQWLEIIEDHHEPGDTFLSLFRSHVRYFFRLIPDLAPMVSEYEAVTERLDAFDAELLAMLKGKHPRLSCVESTGRALVRMARLEE